MKLGYFKLKLPDFHLGIMLNTAELYSYHLFEIEISLGYLGLYFEIKKPKKEQP
jgi:hypothetical protein